MFTKKLFWVLVIGFLNLVSVDAKERSKETKINWKGLMIYRNSFTMAAGKGFDRKYFSANLVAAFFFYEFSVFKIKT